MSGGGAPVTGCDLCQRLPEAARCPSNGSWRKPGLLPVELVLRFWLAHGINPSQYGGYHGQHAQALVDLLAGPEWHCPSCGATTRARMADAPAVQP